MQSPWITSTIVEEVKKKLIGKYCNNSCNYTGVLFDGIEFSNCKCVIECLRQIKLIGAGIPSRYWNFSLDMLLPNIVKKNEKALSIVNIYCEKIKDMVENGHGLFIFGKTGLAKSAIGYYVLRVGLLQGITAFSIRMSQLTKLIFESFSNEESREKLDWIRNDVKLLMIDEIEKDYKIEATSTFSGTQVNEFFGFLYDNQKALIVTSNKSKEGLKGIHADNVIDRLSELIDIALVGESFRKQDFALIKLLEENNTK